MHVSAVVAYTALQCLNAVVCTDDSREMPAYSELMQDASLAIAQVQKALSSRLVLCFMFYSRLGLDSSQTTVFLS